MTGGRAWLLGGGALLALVLNLASLETYPPPHCDETHYAGSAVSWLSRGTFGWPSLTQGDHLGRDVEVPRMGRAYVIGMALMFQGFGVSLAVGRLYSVLGWLCAGGLTLLIGSTLGYRWAGGLAALAFLSSTKALFTSHLIRPEAWLVCAHLAALYVVLLAVAPVSKVPPALAGLVSVLPAEYHGHGFAVLVGLGATFVFGTAGRRPRGHGPVVRYLAGVGLGLCLWVGWRYLGSAPAVGAQLHEMLWFTVFGHAQRGQDSALLANLGTMPAFFRASYRTWGGPGGLLEAASAMGGLIVAAASWRDRRALIAVDALTSLAAFSVLFFQRSVHYSVIWTPLWYLLGFMMLADVARRVRPPTRALLRATAVGVLLVSWVEMGWLAARYRALDFGAMSAALVRMIPPTERVLADAAWWWALKDTHVFIPDEYLGGPLPGDGGAMGTAEGRLGAYLAWLEPRYLVLDQAVDCLDRGGPGFVELARYAGEHCERLGQIDGPWVGWGLDREHVMGQRTTVFRCPWRSGRAE